jgi:hypothetical protein
MKSYNVMAVLLCILLGMAGGTARAGDASCSSLDIRVNGDAIKGAQTCKKGQHGNNDDGIGLTESIEINGPDFIFFLHHLNAGLRTSLIRRSLQEVIDDASDSDRIEGLTMYPAGKGFSAARFVSTFEKSGNVYYCLGMLRYSGTSFSGARHRVFGIYCESNGDEVTNARADEVIAAIETDF